MKSKIKLVIAFVLIILIIVSFYSFKEDTSKTFYYAYNEKISLTPSDKALVIRYKVNKRKKFQNLYFKTQLNENQFKWQDDSTVVIYVLNTFSKDSLFYEIKRDNEVASVHPVYKVESGLEMYITDEVLIKPHNDETKKQINELHKKLGVNVIRSDENYQLIKVPSHLDAIEISKQYQESGMVLFSQPNFICQVDLLQIPNDPYFNNQYYLNNTGQVFADGHWGAADCDIDAPEAWTITQGNNNIIVAVIDEGVTPNHPDLPNARQVILNNSNLADGAANNPSPTANNNHGNACAGIIGATRNNNEGISGIAPNCRIMPIRIFNTDQTGIAVDRVALAINTARQNGARVISNSWGYRSSDQNLHPAIVEAIRSSVNAGCVVVFAAGNTARNVFGDNGYVQFPANVNIQGVLTVGASDRDDFQADYSPSNAIIDIVAPSHRAYSRELSDCIRNIDPSKQAFGIIGENLEIWTIDIPGDAGYNSNHGNNLVAPFNACNCVPNACGALLPNAGNNFMSYTARMGGTSAACPQVAAVAALMLSINPNLTPQQVYDILTANADRVGGYVYTNGRSNEMGFGRLNACRAVTQAIATVLTVSGSESVCTSGESFTVNNLPAGCTINWTFSSNLQSYYGGSNFIALRAIGSGSGWVRATINSLCDQVVLPQKNVWVGPHASISGINSIMKGKTRTYTMNVISGPPITSFNWSADGGIIPVGSTTSSSFTVKAIGCGDGIVSCSFSNSCGSGNSQLGIEIICVNPSMVLFPNPTSDIININLVTAIDQNTGENEVNLLDELATEQILDQYTGEFEIQVWNEYSGLVKRIKDKNNPNLQISLKSKPRGMYYLHLIIDGAVIQKKAILLMD